MFATVRISRVDGLRQKLLATCGNRGRLAVGVVLAVIVAGGLLAMNGFLVLLRCCGDDIPCGFFSSKGSAEKYALSFGWEVPDDIAGLFPGCVDPLNKTIVEFEGGVPVDLEVIARYEGDDCPWSEGSTSLCSGV